MAILDGEFVDDKNIDPAKHRFIGTFREPFSAFEGMVDVFHCRCGEHLFNQQSILDHWQRGHMDAPQYVTVNNESKSDRHFCKKITPGEAITKCFENKTGEFWVGHDIYEYIAQVNYCPYCGKKAPKQVGE